MEIHETIAECMIFANHWVAKRIAEAFPNSALVSLLSYCIDQSNGSHTVVVRYPKSSTGIQIYIHSVAVCSKMLHYFLQLPSCMRIFRKSRNSCLLCFFNKKNIHFPSFQDILGLFDKISCFFC